MVKRARENDDGSNQQTKKPKRDDANNENMTNKARYSKKGFYCPDSFQTLERGKQLNNGIAPYTVACITSHFDHENEWSEKNLPEIMFYIKPPTVGKDLPTRAANGEATEPKIVPDNISILTPEWLIGAWIRLDPEMTLKEIRNRMRDDANYLGGELKKPTHSALNNRLFRKCALIFGHWTGSQAKNQQQIRATLSEGQVEQNTILEVVEVAGQQRLAKKKLVTKEAGTTSISLVNVNVNEDNYQETSYPMNYFKLDVEAEIEPAATPALTTGSSPPSEGDPTTPAWFSAPVSAARPPPQPTTTTTSSGSGCLLPPASFPPLTTTSAEPEDDGKDDGNFGLGHLSFPPLSALPPLPPLPPSLLPSGEPEYAGFDFAAGFEDLAGKFFRPPGPPPPPQQQPKKTEASALGEFFDWSSWD